MTPPGAFASGSRSTLNGSTHSAVAYAEVDPGQHTGRRWHGAEETHLVIEGTAEIALDDERQRIEQGEVAVVPAMAPARRLQRWLRHA